MAERDEVSDSSESKLLKGGKFSDNVELEVSLLFHGHGLVKRG